MSSPSKQDSRNLLGLPAEIRTQIWRYVFGDKQILVTSKRSPSTPLHGQSETNGRYLVCYPFHVGSIALPTQSKGVSSGYNDDLAFCIRFPHVSRRSQPNMFPFTRPFEKAESLSILLVSRQVAYEAGSVFYSTNLFSFHLECCFREWISLLDPINRSYVKAILIDDRYYECTSMKEWMSNMPWLPGVDTISLHSLFPIPNLTELRAMKVDVLEELDEIKSAAVKNGLRMKRVEMVMDVDMEEWEGNGDMPSWEQLVKFMGRLGKRRDTAIKDIDRVVELQEARARRGGNVF